MTQDNILELSDFKYKYYSFNRDFNESRITGKVYLASPTDFNDPFDCQLDVRNNSIELKKGRDWFEDKLISLGFSSDKVSDIVDGLLNDDTIIVEKVRRRQLEKAGILCLTSDLTNITMWAYYAQHSGFCIEYDTDKIITKAVIAFINNLSIEITEHLYVKKGYCLNPTTRAKDKGQYESYKESINFAENNFNTTMAITNSFLTNKIIEGKRVEVVNFIQNMFVKRFGCGIMEYVEELEDDNLIPTLFHSGEKNDNIIKSKYYKKHIDWQKEKEYRLFISLGGKMILDLGKDIVKSLIIGCETTPQQLFEIVSILHRSSMTDVPIKRMIKGSRGLELKAIDHKCLHELCKRFNQKAK